MRTPVRYYKNTAKKSDIVENHQEPDIDELMYHFLRRCFDQHSDTISMNLDKVGIFYVKMNLLDSEVIHSEEPDNHYYFSNSGPSFSVKSMIHYGIIRKLIQKSWNVSTRKKTVKMLKNLYKKSVAGNLIIVLDMTAVPQHGKIIVWKIGE